MKPTRYLLYVFWPVLLAIAIEALAIWVSTTVRSAFDAGPAAIDCHLTPPQWPTYITLLGIITSIVGTVRTIRIGRRWPYIVLSILLLLLVLFGGFVSQFELNFLAGWCF